MYSSGSFAVLIPLSPALGISFLLDSGYFSLIMQFDGAEDP